MSLIIPSWLDRDPKVKFDHEKAMLSTLEQWAEADGWIVSDGNQLPESLRNRTDVFLEKPKTGQDMRISVLPKRRQSYGMIRIDTSTYRIFDLIYQPKTGLWRVETASVPLSNDLITEGWGWLMDYAFRP